MEFNLDEIDYDVLKISASERSGLESIKQRLAKGEQITDEFISYSLFPPERAEPIGNGQYRSTMSFNHTKPPEDKVKIIKEVKKELYELMCIKSEKYKEIQTKAGNGLNSLAIGLSVFIASRIGYEPTIITPILTALVIMFCKVGQNVTCSYLNPEN